MKISLNRTTSSCSQILSPTWSRISPKEGNPCPCDSAFASEFYPIHAVWHPQPAHGQEPTFRVRLAGLAPRSPIQTSGQTPAPPESQACFPCPGSRALGTSWHILAHLGTSWHILAHLGTSWHLAPLHAMKLQQPMRPQMLSHPSSPLEPVPGLSQWQNIATPTANSNLKSGPRASAFFCAFLVLATGVTLASANATSVLCICHILCKVCSVLCALRARLGRPGRSAVLPPAVRHARSPGPVAQSPGRLVTRARPAWSPKADPDGAP